MMRRLTLITITCLSLATAVTPAHADCIDACMAGKDCSLNYSGACSSALGDCSAQCMNQQGPAFGAIAYDRTSGAFGYSFQKSDADVASASAMTYCREHGDACEVMITFSDACAALAAGKNGEASIVASVIGDIREAAQSVAVARCRENGGEGCAVEAWSCSFP